MQDIFSTNLWTRWVGLVQTCTLIIDFRLGFGIRTTHREGEPQGWRTQIQCQLCFFLYLLKNSNQIPGLPEATFHSSHLALHQSKRNYLSLVVFDPYTIQYLPSYLTQNEINESIQYNIPLQGCYQGQISPVFLSLSCTFLFLLHFQSKEHAWIFLFKCIWHLLQKL